MTDEFKEYINNWRKIDGIRPQNEPQFIDMFEKYMLALDDSRDVTFDGDGSYFGKQVTIIEDSVYSNNYHYGFEISYSKDHVSVYRSDHNGFWTPEYINLTSEGLDFIRVRNLIYGALMRLFGLTELSQ